jgi:hypothetical protein
MNDLPPVYLPPTSARARLPFFFTVPSAANTAEVGYACYSWHALPWTAEMIAQGRARRLKANKRKKQARGRTGRR